MIGSKFLTSILSVIMAVSAAGGDIVWEQEYLPADGLPSEQNTKWKLSDSTRGGGTTSVVAKSSYKGQPTLLIKNPKDSGGAIYWDFGGAESGWNSTNDKGTTLEFVAKVTRDSESWASQILWTGGKYGNSQGLRLAHTNNDGVRIDSMNATANFAFVDFQKWHHWRVVIDPDGKSSLYMDDNDKPVWVSPAEDAAESGDKTFLQFGDLGSANIAGTVEIAFVRWTNSKADHGAPISKPAK